MRGIDQILRCCAVHAWQAHDQLRFDAKTSGDLAKTDSSVDIGVRGKGQFFHACHVLHRTHETSAVACGKQLLRICRAAHAAQFFGWCEFDVQQTVRADGVTITATRGSSVGFVQDFFDFGCHGFLFSQVKPRHEAGLNVNIDHEVKVEFKFFLNVCTCCVNATISGKLHWLAFNMQSGMLAAWVLRARPVAVNVM